MKYITTILLVGLMLIAIAGCDFIQTMEGPVRQAELEVLNQELITDQLGNKAVIVSVKNISQVTIELARVEVSFYDENKNLIDSASDSVLNLEPDDIWEFTITCHSERCNEIKSYDLEVSAGSSSGGL